MGKDLGNTLGGGFRNDVFGTSDLADSAQDVAVSQQHMAYGYGNEAMKTANDTSDRASLMAQNPQQLNALQQSLGYAQKQVESDQRLMDAIDPAIMEASKQALGILRGDPAAALGPVQQQMQQQRQQLVNSLREQYGPGAETSAIGQNALRQFDMQANTQSAQIQQGGLSQLFSMGQTRVNGAGFGNLMGAAQGLGQYGMQGAQMALQTGQFKLGAQQYRDQLNLNSAGAGQTANIINKSQQQKFWNDWSSSSMRFGESMASFAGGGGGGGGAKGGGAGGAPDKEGGYASYTNPAASWNPSGEK